MLIFLTLAFISGVIYFSIHVTNYSLNEEKKSQQIENNESKDKNNILADEKNNNPDMLGALKKLDDTTGMINSFLPGSFSKGRINFVEVFISIISSIIGMIYFGYGKRSNQFTMIICGILLMVYTYFINQTFIAIFVGGILVILPFLV